MTDNRLGGMELVSPAFDIHRKSQWRGEVMATWRFLQKHHIIEANGLCGTHIHISIKPGYELVDLQRIACAVIHFETAIEAVVPPERRGNPFATSNWMASPLLAQKGLTRAESIALIERGRWDDEALKPVQEFGMRDYAWNFESLHKHGTIEFRKPPACTTPEEVLSWAELALNFIQAAIRYGTLERLLKVPATVGGLRWFLRQAEVPDLNEPDRLEMIWEGKDMNSAVEPAYEPRKGSTVDLQVDTKLKQMALEDIKRIRIHANSVQEPYW
jgi:Putative amidoligase enzyme